MPTQSSKPGSSRRAVLIFIGIILLVIVYGILTGFVVGVLSNLIYIVIVFPVVMGFNSGKLIEKVVHRAKVRKLSHLVLLSLLSAVTVYGTFHYCRYLGFQLRAAVEIFPRLSQATETKNFELATAFVDYALKKETGYPGFVGYMLYKAREGVSIGRLFRSNSLNLGPALTWLYWLMEFGIILAVTLYLGKERAAMSFCASCGNWYESEKHLGGTAATNKSFLLALIQQKDFLGVGKLIEENAEVPSLELYLQGCGVCNHSQSELVVRHAFQGSRGLQFKDASKMILQPEESGLLLSQLK